EAQTWAMEHNIPQPPESEGSPNTVPILMLTRPDRGAVYRLDKSVTLESQKIEISAAVQGRFSQITLLLDGMPLAEYSAPPYAAYWQLEPGQHTFQAVGVTEGGEEVWSDPVEIEVKR
ncbi:MAG: hypothetical protein E4H27_07640, partial [Anaerolineales bacterium]